MSNHGPTEEQDSAQHQDQLENEEQLREILISMWNAAKYSKYWSDQIITPEDVDFVACALGLSNYRAK
ncbi:MAG: hypothetical protein NUV80_02680 [Candidatus Berkelbacteria bacterium]|nr:hypothetical protein [Candidatus Berkelbacteria bacterium]